MITGIEIKNYRSIGQTKVDFEKAKYKYLEENIFNDKLVNPIAFYGTNGSGKSSFLNAISEIISLLVQDSNSLRPFFPNAVNLELYANKNRGIKKEEDFYNELKSYIKILFDIDNDNYEYLLETSADGYITDEYLKVNAELILERKRNVSKFLNDENRKHEASLYPYLRNLANNESIENKYIKKAYDYLSNIAFVEASKHQFYTKATVEKSYLDMVVDKSAHVKEILKKYKEFPLYDITSTNDPLGKKNYWVNIDLKEAQMVLPISQISDGMLNTSVLLSIVLTLPENSTLVVDELEDTLHPLTILDFFKVVKEKNIQLIFSSHNTFILQQLRPDQIFFANWKDGFSTYKKLSNIYPNIREINNIEKMYLSNLFDEEIKSDK